MHSRLLLAPAVLGSLLLLPGCLKDPPRLDRVQRTAYAAKPAVVRITSVANAEFVYPIEAIKAVARSLELRTVSTDTSAEAVVDTGAGGSGSGFVVHPEGIIVTSGHLVGTTRDEKGARRELVRNGAAAAMVRHFTVEDLRRAGRAELDGYIEAVARQGKLRNIRMRREVELSNGEKLAFEIVAYSPTISERGRDLAILRVKRRNLPTLSLGDSDTVRVGDPIWAIGYPSVASSSDDVIGGWLSRDTDLEATFNDGTITSIKRNALNVPVFQSNVAIYHGNSGGPAVNTEGQAIAVSTWGHTSAEQIKFLVPINVVKSMLGEAKVPVITTGTFDRHYRAALQSASVGRWKDARKELAAANAAFPNSPDLIRFIRDADRAIAETPVWSEYPALTMGAAALGAIALAGGAIVVLRSRPRRERPGPPDQVISPVPRGTEGGPVTGAGQLLGKLTFLTGERAGEKLGLGGSGIRIGREASVCEIVLENPKVSRLHAEIVSIDGQVLLIDRNSSNGTYVNDRKIERQVLRDGDIIYFGGRNAVSVAFHV
jgi:S1-C subfamily serine protease